MRPEIAIVAIAFAVAVALGGGVIWAIGVLTGHLAAKRTGAKPYKWQGARLNPASSTEGLSRHIGKQGFWSDLKATATKPYAEKTTLEKAYGACVLLFAVGVVAVPYEYYFGMRIGVCIALYFFIVAAYQQRPKSTVWPAALVGVALLYNPIIPVQLGDKFIWTVVNAASVYLLYRAKRALALPIKSEAPEAT